MARRSKLLTVSRRVHGARDLMLNNQQVLSLAAIGGPWFRPVDGGDWQALLATAVVALIALLGIVWLSRARSTRRWKAVLDAYAAREIAHDRRRKAPPLEPRTT